MAESGENREFMPLMAFLARVAGIDLDKDGRAIKPCMRFWLPRDAPSDGLWAGKGQPPWAVMIALDLTDAPGWEALDRLAAMIKRAQDRGIPVLLEHCPQEGWESAATRHITFRLRGYGGPAGLSQSWHTLYEQWQDDTLAAYDRPRHG